MLDNILVCAIFLDLALVTMFKATRAQRGEVASMVSVESILLQNVGYSLFPQIVR